MERCSHRGCPSKAAGRASCPHRSGTAEDAAGSGPAHAHWASCARTGTRMRRNSSPPNISAHHSPRCCCLAPGQEGRVRGRTPSPRACSRAQSSSVLSGRATGKSANHAQSKRGKHRVDLAPCARARRHPPEPHRNLGTFRAGARAAHTRRRACAAQCRREQENLELTAQRLERSGTDAEVYGGLAQRAVKIPREHLPRHHDGIGGRAAAFSRLFPGEDSARAKRARWRAARRSRCDGEQASDVEQHGTHSLPHSATHGASGGAAATHLAALGGAIARYRLATVVRTIL